MSVHGVGRNYDRNNVATAKSTKSINSAEKAINADTKNEGAVSSSKQMEPEYANYTKEDLVEDMEWNQEIRDKMNDAIHQAFEENGIVIPKGADLRLTVDPYDFFIHASGVDEELAKRIEAALNQGKNGYYLYEHIAFCDPVNYGVEEPLQYISGDKEKMVVYHFVNRLTGYDIRELENRGGKFYTPDGEDLWEVLKDKYDKLAADGNADVSTLMRYEAAYRRVAAAGWERTTDCNLAIGYKDGCLYDLDTSYGYGPGQTAWQDRVRRWYEGVQKEYLHEREEDLKREENTSSKFEMAVKETEDYMRLTFGEGSVSGSQRAEVQLDSKIPVLLEMLERLKKEGMIVPLTNRVLNLRGESRGFQGFDFKA